MEPLSDYIQRSTGRQVLQLNSQSYQQFLQKAQQQQFDLVYAPVHYAALLTEEHGYKPLLLFAAPYQPVVISKRLASMDEISSAKALRIATPNQSALVSRMVMQKIGPAAHIEWVVKSTHDRSLYALLSDEVDAAIVSSFFLSGVGEDARSRLKVLASYGVVPGDVLLARQALLTHEPQLQKAVDHFSGSAESTRFVERWKLEVQFKPVDPQLLAPYKALAEAQSKAANDHPNSAAFPGTEKRPTK